MGMSVLSNSTSHAGLPSNPSEHEMAAVRSTRLTVVSASNARYYPGLLVTLYSLLCNLSKNVSVDFVVLAEGLSDLHSTTLRRVLGRTSRGFSLTTISVDLHEFQQLRTDYGGSRMAYARLLMPKSISSDFALYVDSDIVVQRDVSKLVELPWPKECLLHAVKDPKGPTFAGDGMNCDRLGIPLSAPYFNSGFMWMNLKRWREQDIAGKCAEFIQHFTDEIRWWDQSVLNAVLWQSWQQLDERWNFLVDHSLRKLEIYPFLSRQDINAHYLGPDKPWLGFNPYRHFFDAYNSRISNLIPAEIGSCRLGTADTLKRIGFFVRRGYRNYGSFCKQSLLKLRA
jgi:lipopolysaccharide biosynthesis glycosyltransferase